MSGHVVALSGGVGGAKLVQGLSQVLPPGALTVIVNTGDDFRHLGLAISPDLDSVVYALAGLADPVRGWGRRDETWSFMAALRTVGGEVWFQLGDADLAMHVERSAQLADGATLSAVTARVCRALGIDVSVLPMSDDPVRTRVLTESGWIAFQDYFVRQQCRPAVRQLDFAGAAEARPQPAALAALQRADLRAIVICPSNPFVSVEPILAVPGLRAALEAATAPVIAVTPIVGGKALKGPAAKMMSELGLRVSAEGVARRYAPLIDLFVCDDSDPLPPAVSWVRWAQAPTLMHDAAARARLGAAVLLLADSLKNGSQAHP